MVAGVGQCQNGINWREYFSHNDGVLTWVKPTSNRVKAGSIAGWVDGKGYLRVRLLGRSYGVHRIVYEMHYGPIPDGMEIDHIDHNPLNNKIENLRVVCRAGNMKTHQNQFIIELASLVFHYAQELESFLPRYRLMVRQSI